MLMPTVVYVNQDQPFPLLPLVFCRCFPVGMFEYENLNNSESETISILKETFQVWKQEGIVIAVESSVCASCGH